MVQIWHSYTFQDLSVNVLLTDLMDEVHSVYKLTNVAVKMDQYAAMGTSGVPYMKNVHVR